MGHGFEDQESGDRIKGGMRNGERGSERRDGRDGRSGETGNADWQSMEQGELPIADRSQERVTDESIK